MISDILLCAYLWGGFDKGITKYISYPQTKLPYDFTQPAHVGYGITLTSTLMMGVN